MKTPKINKCPCCEIDLIKHSPSAQCSQIKEANGHLQYSILSWVCTFCGCEWVHGQFNEKETNKC